MSENDNVEQMRQKSHHSHSHSHGEKHEKKSVKDHVLKSYFKLPPRLNQFVPAFPPFWSHPKLMRNAGIDEKTLSQYDTTYMEQNYKHPLHHTTDMGIHINLVDPNKFENPIQKVRKIQAEDPQKTGANLRDLEEKKKKFEEKYISPKDKLLLLDDNGNLPQNLASGLSPSLAITFSMKSNEQQAIIDETNKKLEDWVINSNNRIKNKRKRDDNIGIEEENEDNDKNSSEKPLKNRKTLQNKHKKLTTSNAILFDFETIETAVEKGGLADEMSTHSSNFATKPGERMTLNAFLFRTQIAAISKTFDDSKTIFPDNSSELSKLTHPTKADLTITKVTKVFPDIRSSFSEFSKNSKENSKISARLLFSHFKSDPIPISKYPPNEKGVAFKDLDYSTQVQFKKKLISDPQNQYIFRDSILFESNRFNELVNSANNANNMNEGINQESNQEPIKNILFCSPKKLWNNRKSVPSQSGALEEYELVKNLQMTADEEIDKDKELLVSWEKFSNKSSVDVITWKAIDERIELNRAPIPIKESINAKILIQNE